MNTALPIIAAILALIGFAVLFFRRKPRYVPQTWEENYSDLIATLENDIALLTVEINRRKKNKKRASDLEAARQMKRNEILRLESVK